MSTQPLPLSILCDVSVSVTPAGVAVPAFNQGLIIGNSARIPSYGANSRCVLVPTSTVDTSLAALGYQPTDPEYIEAQLYADQKPQAQYLWVGCQDPSALLNPYRHNFLPQYIFWHYPKQHHRTSWKWQQKVR